MANSYFHAQASSRKWGGEPEDYIAIHEFIDGSKRTFGDVRHRALLHNTWGVWLCQEMYGRVIHIEKAGGGTKPVAVREIAEQHIIEDLGFIPTTGDWLENMDIKVWMGGKQKQMISRGHLLNDTVKEGKK